MLRYFENSPQKSQVVDGNGADASGKTGGSFIFFMTENRPRRLLVKGNPRVSGRRRNELSRFVQVATPAPGPTESSGTVREEILRTRVNIDLTKETFLEKLTAACGHRRSGSS